MMIGQKIFIGLLLQLAVSLSFAMALYPFDSPRQDSQFQHLLRELRCLVCQNQDLSDSNSDLAKDLRKEVYDQVKANKSDAEIMDYLSTRYGDFILFKPPVKSLTFILWFGPILFLGLGLIIFWRMCIRNPHNRLRVEHE
jgi:cytochrome c-type biogenesis protein CcmH